MKNKAELSGEKLLSSQRISAKEKDAVSEILMLFQNTEMPVSDKAANFTNWARTRDVTRFLVRHEIFKEILHTPGCIFECGVHWGGGVSSWIHLSEIFEPVAFTRRIYGFDTFSGFKEVSEVDNSNDLKHSRGDFSLESSVAEIKSVLELIDTTRKINLPSRLNLIQGDIVETLPKLLEKDRSISIALLYLDLDLHIPTKKTIEACLPKMPKGSIVVLDQFADPDWPGETQALMDTVGISNVELRSFPFCPRISYFKI